MTIRCSERDLNFLTGWKRADCLFSWSWVAFSLTLTDGLPAAAGLELAWDVEEAKEVEEAVDVEDTDETARWRANGSMQRARLPGLCAGRLARVLLCADIFARLA